MLVIIDADGTLTPYRPSSRHPFSRTLLPRVREKCKKMQEGNHVLALASNQGGARQGREGRLSFGAVHAHMRWLCAELGFVAYRFATKPPRKKPAPAMLLELMRELGYNPKDTIFVGDQESDQQAAEAAGCRFEYSKEFFESPELT